MIDVAIVEDDKDIREAVKEFLADQPDFACRLACESVELFLNFLNKDTQPDIILMDIGLPGMSGISGIKIIKEQYPNINLIVFTIYHDSDKIFRSLCAGASGYLLKNSPFSENNAEAKSLILLIKSFILSLRASIDQIISLIAVIISLLILPIFFDDFFIFISSPVD